MASVLYLDVTTAATETVRKILSQRKTAAGQSVKLHVSATGGETASVTVNRQGGVYMRLPSLPADAPLSRGEADRILGFIAHECLHVLHTDWDVWARIVANGPRVKLWANALEDVRIEAKEIRAGHYPALRGVLAGLMDHMHYRALTTAPRVIGASLADAPYCAAIMGRVANRYDLPTARNLPRDMSPTVARLVNAAVTGVKTCRSTEDVLVLALQLVAMETAAATQPKRQQPKQQQPEPEPEPEPEAGEAGEDDAGEAGEAGEGDAGDAGDAGEDDAGDAGEDDAGDAGEDDAGEGDAGEAGQDNAGEAGEGDAGEGDAGEGDAGEAGQNDAGQDDAGEAGEAGEAGTDTGQGDGHGDHTGAEDTAGGLDPSASLDDMVKSVTERSGGQPEAADQGLHGYKNIMASPDSVPGTGSRNLVSQYDRLLPGRAILHGQISRLLVSPERSWTTHRETSGRLDRRAMARLGTGAPDVFSQKRFQPGMDTALLILIDLSGSMRGPRHAMAVVTAYHIACAAEDAGARVAIYGFTEVNDPGQTTAMARMHPLIPFGMSVRQNADRIAGVGPDISTPLSPAILAGATVLLDQPAGRRILMALTDGDCDYGNHCVTQACNVAGAWGVETVGVGMSAPDVVKAFPAGYSINVADLDQLGKTGLGVLAAMLEDANPE